jgi:hypothetical protein
MHGPTAQPVIPPWHGLSSDIRLHHMTRHAFARTSALLLGACSLALGAAAPAAAQRSSAAEPPTVKLSPRARSESVPSEVSALLARAGVEAFLTETEVVSLEELNRMPRIVATPENRLLLGQGDRAFARAAQGLEGPYLTAGEGNNGEFRIARSTRALRDPATGEVLGHEVQFVGKATLVSNEQLQTVSDGKGERQVISPATLRITSVKEEIRTGDRLLPATATDLNQLVGSEPTQAVQGQVLGIYGNGVTFAGQNQVIVINRGLEHGLMQGHLLSILKDSQLIPDRTDGKNTPMQLNGETNGRVMVFRTFDKVSYALILQNTDAVKVGDRISAR